MLAAPLIAALVFVLDVLLCGPLFLVAALLVSIAYFVAIVSEMAIWFWEGMP